MNSPISGRNEYSIFLPNVNGGVNSVINNLLLHKPPQVSATVITYRNKSKKNCSSADTTEVPVTRIDFEYNDKDNIYYTAEKLRSLIPSTPGMIVATDSVELTMVNITSLDAKVIFIVMGDFNHYYDLALLHESIIDGFIAISNDIYTRLVFLLPHRKDSIHLAYFPTPDVTIVKHEPNQNRLKAIFVGRLDELKNPLLLVNVDAILKKQNIEIEWTVVGDGHLMPAMAEATRKCENFHFAGVISNTELRKLYTTQDLFVMTSLSEGLPVSLIEAMKTGLVPVISDIAGGIREIVDNNVTGFLCDVNNANDFAYNIKKLSTDHSLYSKISHTARLKITTQFNATQNSEKYFQLFSDIPFTPGTKKYNFRSSNRLDKKWIPNFLVKIIRNLIFKSAVW